MPVRPTGIVVARCYLSGSPLRQTTRARYIRVTQPESHATGFAE